MYFIPADFGRLTPQRTIRSTDERAPAAPIADFLAPDRTTATGLVIHIQMSFVRFPNDSAQWRFRPVVHYIYETLQYL